MGNGQWGTAGNWVQGLGAHGKWGTGQIMCQNVKRCQGVKKMLNVKKSNIDYGLWRKITKKNKLTQ